MSSVPNQLQELRAEIARLDDRIEKLDLLEEKFVAINLRLDKVNELLTADVLELCQRIKMLERENAAWRDSFSRGSLPPPRPVITN